MIAHNMPRIPDLTEQIGVAQDVFSNHEKGGAYAVLSKHVEHPRGYSGDGAVVECEVDTLASAVWHTPDGVAEKPAIRPRRTFDEVHTQCACRCWRLLFGSARLSVLEYSADVDTETVEALAEGVDVASGVVVGVDERDSVGCGITVGTADIIVKAAATQVADSR